MKSKIAGLVGPLLLCGSLSVQAATVALGNLGPPGFATFGDSFSATGAFTDIYTFNVSAPADVLGLMLAIDFSPAFNISLASPQLFSGSPGSASVVAPHIGCVSM
jgi:hypothetical protein